MLVNLEITFFSNNKTEIMLDRLEASDHIQRVYDSADRRTVKIRMSEETKSMKSRYDEVSIGMSEIFYEGFDDAEIIGFENALARILENLIRKEKSQYEQ